MKFVADLHIHSPYSRATSHLLRPENLVIWAIKKGITVIGTGDFTHPAWLSELKEKLEEAEDGLYKLKGGIVSNYSPLNGIEPRFMISGEISCIYKKGGRLRKIHHLILLPDMESAERFNKKLEKIGNLEADGRPILGIDSKDLLEMLLDTCPDAFLIPAHIWTPWFSLFGSRSGFDSIEECFEDLKDHIYALETGLSSDPPMNRLLSSLDRYLLVSNSDAHSPTRLGREANIFNVELGYRNMIQAMKDGKGFVGTIEFFPEEGKYHLDGHRRCNVCLDPKESISLNNICPVCGNPITVGVLHRVYELADRKEPKLTKDFYSLIPLPEILSEIMNCGVETRKVKDAYEKLILELGPEIQILMDTPIDEIERVGGDILAEAIYRMRSQKVIKKPGYDGEYGRIRLFHDDEKDLLSGQTSLFQMERKREDKRDKEISLFVTRKMTDTASTSDHSNSILGRLNPEQKEAVLYKGGHLIIVAGPGSGKTLTLTHRIAHFICSGIAKPDQILALTFTRKAAEEMDQRIKALLSSMDISSEGIWISTFHSFCLWLLREKGDLIGISKDFSICPEWEIKDLVREISPKKRLVSKLLKMLPILKRPDSSKIQDSEILDLFKKYQARLKALNMLDMDDLEIGALKLLNEFPDVANDLAMMRPYIFVDEYQDTNPVQVGILKAISRSNMCQICAIGDPDQAIYGFRGADRNSFFRFGMDFKGAREITLKRNYRSSQVILKASASVMDKPSMEGGIKGKDYIILNPCATGAEEAESVVEYIERLMGGISYFSLDSKRVASHEGDELSFGDIAILYRINSLGDEMEKALKRAGIPMIRAGEVPIREIYPVNIIYRLLLYLLHRDKHHLNAYLRLASKNGISPISDPIDISMPVFELIEKIIELHNFDTLDDYSIDALTKIKDLASSHKGDLSSFLDLMSLERGIDQLQLMGDRISLMSIHASKGLEWKVVFIIGCEDGIIPCTIFGDTDIEEEKRLFYVGMTRAKELLVLSYARKREINGRIIYNSPSPFLNKIPDEFIKRYEKKQKKIKKEATQLSLF